MGTQKRCLPQPRVWSGRTSWRKRDLRMTSEGDNNWAESKNYSMQRGSASKDLVGGLHWGCCGSGEAGGVCRVHASWLRS